MNNNYNKKNKYKPIMRKQPETVPVRDLMPKGFLRKIAAETGSGRSHISTVVTDERTTAEIWPAVEKLAKETNAAAYEARKAYLDYQRSASQAA